MLGLSRKDRGLLLDLADRVKALQHEADLMRTVLIVKEPNTVQAAQAYDGLRKQIGASAAERRSHLNQLVAMSVAVSRATAVEDLVPMLREWMEQAGVVEVHDLPLRALPRDYFEDVTGEGLDGATGIEVLEPAYVDANTSALLRLGRAQADRSHLSRPGDRAQPNDQLLAEDPPIVADAADLNEGGNP